MPGQHTGGEEVQRHSFLTETIDSGHNRIANPKIFQGL
jgi:hypothetical protein